MKATAVFYEIARASDGDFCVTMDLPKGLAASQGQVRLQGTDLLLVYPGQVLRLGNFPVALAQQVRQRGNLLIAIPNGTQGFTAHILPLDPETTLP